MELLIKNSLKVYVFVLLMFTQMRIALAILCVVFCVFVSHASAQETEFVKVKPEVGEWSHRLCTLAQVSHYIARCEAAGGTWQGSSASPSCAGADFEAFRKREPADMARAFYSQLYSFCPTPSSVFSGWGKPTFDSYCGGGTGPKYAYGVESGNTGHVTVSGVIGEDCQSSLSKTIGVGRGREVICPEGSAANDFGEGRFCYQECPVGYSMVIDGECVKPPPKDCTNDNRTSNPCHISTGAKFLTQTDVSSGLVLTRHYHSLSLIDKGFGKGWHNPYFKDLFVFDGDLSIFEGSGRMESWQKTSDVWQGDADSDYSIKETATGFTITDQHKRVSKYDSDGRLLSEKDSQGRTQTYRYDSDNRLIRVSDYFGFSLSFDYSTEGKDHITAVTDASGAVYHYEYDANDNLIAVIYPDTTPEDQTDNPRKIYHYENPDFPNHLTGITDENGDRYATFEYNAQGKAIVSELGQTTNAVGQQRVELSY